MGVGGEGNKKRRRPHPCASSCGCWRSASALSASLSSSPRPPCKQLSMLQSSCLEGCPPPTQLPTSHRARHSAPRPAHAAAAAGARGRPEEAGGVRGRAWCWCAGETGQLAHRHAGREGECVGCESKKTIFFCFSHVLPPTPDPPKTAAITHHAPPAHSHAPTRREHAASTPARAGRQAGRRAARRARDRRWRLCCLDGGPRRFWRRQSV